MFVISITFEVHMAVNLKATTYLCLSIMLPGPWSPWYDLETGIVATTIFKSSNYLELCDFQPQHRQTEHNAQYGLLEVWLHDFIL